MKLQKENNPINDLIKDYKTINTNENLKIKETNETLISTLRIKDKSKRHEIIIKDRGSLWGFEVIFKEDKEIVGTWDTSIISNVYNLTSQTLWDKYHEQIVKEFEGIVGYDIIDLELPTTKEKIEENSKKTAKYLKEFAEFKNTSEVFESKTTNVKNRKELAELINEAKKNNQSFNIIRSTEEGYRYVFTTKALNEVQEQQEQEEPIQIEIKDEELTQIEENAFNSMVTNSIITEWELIDSLKSVATTFTLEKPELTSIIEIINSIVDEKIMHVGMLQKVLELIDEDQMGLIKAGEEKAEAIEVEPANDLNKG